MNKISDENLSQSMKNQEQKKLSKTIIHIKIKSHRQTKNSFNLIGDQTKSINPPRLTNHFISQRNNHSKRNQVKIHPVQRYSSTSIPKVKENQKTFSNKSFNQKKKKYSKTIITLSFILSILVITAFAVALATLIITLNKNSVSKNISPTLRWNSTGIIIAGTTGISGNTSNTLNLPQGLTLKQPDILYVSDTNNHRIEKLIMNTMQSSTVAGLANSTSGSTSDALNSPVGIVDDDNGNIYVADRYNHRIQLWSSGASTGTTVAGTTGVFGSSNSQFHTPIDVTLDSNSGTLYIADSLNHRIMRYYSGVYSGSIVAGNNSAGLSYTQLSTPTGVYFDLPTNSLIIANLGANNVVRWTLGDTHWSIIAGNLNGNSGLTSTELNSPRSVTLDPMGNVYIADTFNYRIQFFLNGQTTGTAIAGQTGLPGNSLNKLDHPSKILLDSQLNLYVADTDNQRIIKFLRY